MRVFDGALIKTTKAISQDNGTRLYGELSAFTVGPFSIPTEIDCTTPEKSTKPAKWECTFTALIFAVHVDLKKVKINKDKNCGIFQDGTKYEIPD